MFPYLGAEMAKYAGSRSLFWLHLEAGIADLAQRNLPTAPETSPNIQ